MPSRHPTDFPSWEKEKEKENQHTGFYKDQSHTQRKQPWRLGFQTAILTQGWI